MSQRLTKFAVLGAGATLAAALLVVTSAISQTTVTERTAYVPIGAVAVSDSIVTQAWLLDTASNRVINCRYTQTTPAAAPVCLATKLP